jgi:hypothetical protein
MSKHQMCVNKAPVDRTNFIKTLRLAGRLELRQALDLTVHLERYGHSILVASIDLRVAEHLAEALRETGCRSGRAGQLDIDTYVMCPTSHRQVRVGSIPQHSQGELILPMRFWLR